MTRGPHRRPNRCWRASEFLKPRICGAVPVKSTVRRSPFLTTATRSGIVHIVEAIVVERALPRGRRRPAARRSPRAGGGRRGRGCPRNSATASSKPRSLDDLGDLLAADARRAEHRAEVAVEQVGAARVEQQQLPEVFAHRAALDQLQRRQTDAFVEDLGGLRVVGSGRAAADIGLMRAVAREGDQPAARRTPAARSPSRADGCRRRRRGRSAGRRRPASMRPANALSRARTAKPPPPVWIGMPSACETSVPAASVMKQEKSCDWLKIGLREVRIITQPICRAMWSSRFCTSASEIGSRSVMRQLPSASAMLKLPPRRPRGGRRRRPGRSSSAR